MIFKGIVMKKLIALVVLVICSIGYCANEIPTQGGNNNTWGTDLNNYLQKGQGWIDLRAFLPVGFVVDGSVDYTTEIQAAIDASEWRSLFIPTGKWQITSSLVLDGAKGYNIFGNGWDPTNSNESSIIKNSGVGNAFTISSAGQTFNMIRMSNFMILGTFSPTPSAIGISMTNVHNVFLDRMYIKSHGGSGVVVNNGFGVKITRSLITLNGNHGINLNGKANQVSIIGCVINDNSRNTGFTNLQITGGSGTENLAVTVIGNDISSAGVTGAVVEAFNVNVAHTLGLVFMGNYLEFNTTTGDLFFSTSTCKNLVIKGNYFQDGKFQFNGVSGSNSEISNNIFRKVVEDTQFEVIAAAGDGSIKVFGNALINGATAIFTGLTPFPTGTLADGGSETWNPAEIADGNSLDNSNVTVTGAALGDIAFASLGVDLTGLILTAAVTEPNVVVCTLTNSTDAAVNLASSTLKVRVFQVD